MIKMRWVVTGLAVALIAGVFVLGCGSETHVDGDTPGGSFSIQGSDTMVNLGQALAEHYMYEVNARAALSVTGGGSGTGIAALINDNVDIAQSSRAMRQQEIDNAAANNVEVYEFIVGQDGIALAVHQSNPIERVTAAQLKGIFTGSITNWADLGWSEGGNISVYSRQSNSGTYVFFNELIMDGEDWADGTRFMPGSSAIAEALTTDRQGIGYFGVGYVRTPGNRVLELAQSEEGPYISSLESEKVNSGEYLLARPLYFYTNGVPTGLVRHYLDWVLSDEGQNVIMSTGFYRVTPEYEEHNRRILGGLQ